MLCFISFHQRRDAQSYPPPPPPSLRQILYRRTFHDRGPPTICYLLILSLSKLNTFLVLHNKKCFFFENNKMKVLLLLHLGAWRIKPWTKELRFQDHFDPCSSIVLQLGIIWIFPLQVPACVSHVLCVGGQGGKQQSTAAFLIAFPIKIALLLDWWREQGRRGRELITWWRSDSNSSPSVR